MYSNLIIYNLLESNLKQSYVIQKKKINNFYIIHLSKK